MGWVELARLAQKIGTETKIVFFVRRHILTNISQSDVVQGPLLVAGALEEVEHLVGRAARRVVAHEHAAQDRHCVLCSRLLHRPVALDVDHRLEGEESARVVGDQLRQEGGAGRPGGE